jgi:uncharacterized protein (DUF488 family)
MAERLTTSLLDTTAMDKTVWTIGHSTRPLPSFLALLDTFRIEAVADVRRFPGSRRQPQYAQATLSGALAEHGITYRWIAALGGRRRPQPDSPNIAWRNSSFRGYADYMVTKEFEEGFNELLEIAVRLRTALMCSEAVWWRCHRALIADLLCVRGINVVHIIGETHAVVHPYTSPARIVQGQLSYDPAEGLPLHKCAILGAKSGRVTNLEESGALELPGWPGNDCGGSQ